MLLRQRKARPGSSVVEHLHGKQVVVGSIPILGKKQRTEDLRKWQKKLIRERNPT